MKSLIIALLTSLLFAATAVAADRIEVIQLHNRSAQEIIPIIKPLLPENTGLSAQGYRLIVRGSDTTQARVAELIAELDSAPQRLVISLKRGGNTTYNRSEISAGGTIEGDDASVTVGRDGPAGVRAFETRREGTDNAVQRINTISGRQAFIRVGQLIPTGERSIDRYGRRVDSVQYRSASSGFYVLPRIAGDQVTLNISQNTVSLDRHGRQRFNTQAAQTVLRGKVGEWLPLGGVTQSFNESGSGILHSTRRSGSTDTELYIRVDIVE